MRTMTSAAAERSGTRMTPINTFVLPLMTIAIRTRSRRDGNPAHRYRL